MDIESFREYCLSLGDVSEKMPFGKFARRYDSILAFYLCGHMFCFIDIDNFTCADIKSTPEEIAELRANHTSLGNPINRSLRHWIKIHFGGDISTEQLLRLVKRAYDIVLKQYSPHPKS